VSGLANEARTCRLGHHRAGWIGERDHDAHFSVFALDDATKVADHLDADILAALYRGDDTASAVRPIMKIDVSVNATIGALLVLAVGLRSKIPSRPPLELIFITPCQFADALREINLDSEVLPRQQIIGFMGTSKTAHRIRDRIEGAGELGRVAGQFSGEMIAIPGFGLIDR
jgi:hypothetical protein